MPVAQWNVTTFIPVTREKQFMQVSCLIALQNNMQMWFHQNASNISGSCQLLRSKLEMCQGVRSSYSVSRLRYLEWLLTFEYSEYSIPCSIVSNVGFLLITILGIKMSPVRALNFPTNRNQRNSTKWDLTGFEKYKQSPFIYILYSYTYQEISNLSTLQ